MLLLTLWLALPTPDLVCGCVSNSSKMEIQVPGKIGELVSLFFLGSLGATCDLWMSLKKLTEDSGVGNNPVVP